MDDQFLDLVFGDRKDAVVKMGAAKAAAAHSYVVANDDGLAEEHSLVRRMIAEHNDACRLEEFPPAKNVPAVKSALAMSAEKQARVVTALMHALKRYQDASIEVQKAMPRGTAGHVQFLPGFVELRRVWNFLFASLNILLRRKLPLRVEIRQSLLLWCVDFVDEYSSPLAAGVDAAESLAAECGKTPELLRLTARLHDTLKQKNSVRYRHYIARLHEISADPAELPLESGEAWADTARAEIGVLPDEQKIAWKKMLILCSEASGSAPGAKWLNAASALIEQIGKTDFRRSVASWFPLTANGRANTEANRTAWLAHCMNEFLGNYWVEICERLPERGPDVWDAIAQWVASASASGDIWAWLRDFSNQDEVKNAFGKKMPRLEVPPTPPVYVPANDLLSEPHMDILRGLAWACGLFPSAELARALTALALSAYRKVPGKGPRAVRVGNACITALAMMGGLDAVGQLAVLKVKVKFGTAQAQIEKALTACAEKSGIPRDELEEMSVPAYGLTEVGRAVEAMGDCSAELRIVDSREVAVIFRGADGKERKSLPAAVKAQCKDELKEFAAAKKDIEKMLPAQAERLDALFLAQKSWALEPWLERYLEHPLVGALARRLIWNFTTRGTTTPGVWLDGKLTDRTGTPVPLDAAQTRVALWHPLDQPPDVVLGWRVFLEERQIRQPFKQAHREIYLLTPAEAATVTYSNRFAAHLLRQHQFNALCAARGWKNRLCLVYDGGSMAATRGLPAWGLRAEFWTEGTGDESNDTGVFLYVATDQVRFHRTVRLTGDAAIRARLEKLEQVGTADSEAAIREIVRQRGATDPDIEFEEPIPLADVPPLVFSEIMRDVDLFVGVGSVGNDPAWRDGGQREQFGGHWQRFAFGDLSATAKTRREVLERLIPKLKIAAQCSFEDKFLVVRGKLRAYKIHLGSGNILMSPNDQYLCIVASRGKAEPGNLFLPFEGDGVLSVILSKALLLAADDKITDESITRQIR